MKPKLLFLTNLLPFPLDNGGKIKSFNTLFILKDLFQIDLLCFVESDDDLRYLPEFRKLGINVKCIKRILRHQEAPLLLFWETTKSLFSPLPYIVNKYSSSEMRTAVREAFQNKQYSCFFVDHLRLFDYVDVVRSFRKSLKVILDQHNVECDIIKRRLEQTRNPLAKLFLLIEYTKLLIFERKSCERADLVFAITDVDRDRFLKLTFGRIKCLTAPFYKKDVNGVFSLASKKIILFLGTMSWYPNEHGLLWFYENVFKAYNLSSQGWKLLIVGSSPSIKIKELSSDTAITVTGRVDNLQDYLSQAAVSIVPLFIGGGMRIKIIDLFSFGIPVISSTIGCEGIQVTDKENILLADTALKFNEALMALDTDSTLREKLSERSLEFVKENYSLESAKRTYQRVFNDCGVLLP